MAGRILHRSPWVCLGFYMVCVVVSRISCDFGRGAPSPSLAGWPAGRLAHKCIPIPYLRSPGLHSRQRQFALCTMTSENVGFPIGNQRFLKSSCKAGTAVIANATRGSEDMVWVWLILFRYSSFKGTDYFFLRVLHRLLFQLRVLPELGRLHIICLRVLPFVS